MKRAAIQKQHLPHTSATRSKSAAAGCIRTLFVIVAVVVIVYVAYVLLLSHHF